MAASILWRDSGDWVNGMLMSSWLKAGTSAEAGAVQIVCALFPCFVTGFRNTGSEILWQACFSLWKHFFSSRIFKTRIFLASIKGFQEEGSI